MIVLWLSLALSVSGNSDATAQVVTSPARSTVLEVTDAGAFTRHVRGATVVDPATSQALTTGGALWSRSDGGQAWIGTAVSIGNRASQVFAEYDLNNEAAELFSVYDASPPSAAWTDATPLGTEFRNVDSAAASDTHVAVHQIVIGGNLSTRQAVVRKYSSSSATPDWTYTFAPIINAACRVGVSRDGQTIVAALMNDSAMQVEVAVFGPGSNVPVSYTTIPVPGNMRGFDLSADGSTLYFSALTTAHVFDVATTTVVFTTNIGASFDSHAISGDGSVFAFGNFNAMSVWERSGATYTNTHTATKGGANYCAQIDISDDSSTVAFGWYNFSNGLNAEIVALDVATKVETMSENVNGLGTFQNLVADISCSADGSRFAVGMWGDEAGTVDEVRLYARDQNTPLETLDLPGSVFDLDLSEDGQRVAAGSKAVHANTLGSGGRIDLLDAGGEDLIVRGKPSAGATVNFEVHAPAGKTVVLLTALDEQPPMVFPGIGTLHIDRTTITFTTLGLVPAGDVLTAPVGLPAGAGMIGQSRYYQVLTLFPRTLSTDWLKLTFLP